MGVRKPQPFASNGSTFAAIRVGRSKSPLTPGWKDNRRISETVVDEMNLDRFHFVVILKQRLGERGDVVRHLSVNDRETTGCGRRRGGRNHHGVLRSQHVVCGSCGGIPRVSVDAAQMFFAVVSSHVGTELGWEGQ